LGPASRCWSLPVLVAVCLGAFLGAGCSSSGKKEPTPFASVQIHDQAVDRVCEVTAEVFHDHGYKVTRNGAGNFFFEKKGSLANDLAYGNWMGERIWVRVKATVDEMSTGNCQIRCEAFLLRNHGEPLEEEIRITKLHSSQYQEILDEVALRLNSKAVKPN